jgi:predicted phosphodiesterase
MLIGALADIHGNFEAMAQAIDRHRDVPFWLCVGDVGSRTGAYPEPDAPVYWIKGNNEDFDKIAAWETGAPQPRNMHYIRNGTAVDVSGVRVAGLGGTFAPTWFDTPAAELPHARASDDKRRHFVREEVDACKRLRGVDILMTHEAARPFILVDESAGGRQAKRRDAGKPAINSVLAAMAPRLHLCGHHHRFVETEREGVRSVCIDRINRSYLLIDTDSWRYEKVDQ